MKKSKAWCSKRYAMTQKGLHSLASQLLENGHTEDIELLKALSSLVSITGWTESTAWAKKVQEGKAGREDIRAALKAAKAKAKEEKEKAAKKAEKVSHAKPNEPPPPPPWEIEGAMEELSQALTWANAEKSAIELFNSWTEEEQKQIEARLDAARAIGAGEDGFRIIGNLVMNGLHFSPYCDIDLMAMIAGLGGKTFDAAWLLGQLQGPREKA